MFVNQARFLLSIGIKYLDENTEELKVRVYISEIIVQTSLPSDL